MKKKLLLSIILSFFFACAAAAERMPGTNIEINIPSNFSKCGYNYCLKDEDSSQISTSWSRISLENIINSVKNNSSYKILYEKKITLSSQPAILFLLEITTSYLDVTPDKFRGGWKKESKKKYYREWLVMFKDNLGTRSVKVRFPQNASNAVSNSMREIVLSAKLNKNLMVYPSENNDSLSFLISKTEYFKQAKNIKDGLILTSDGEPQPDSEYFPYIKIRGSYIRNFELKDEITFTKKSLKETDSINNIKIIKEYKNKIDGLPGILILASAQDKKSQKKVLVYHCLLFAKNGYYTFQGFADYQKSKEYYIAFYKVLNTFRQE